MKKSSSTTLLTIFGCLLSVLLPLQAWAEDKPLVGFWESVDTSRGGIGSTLEFAADGTFRRGIVVLVETEYRLEGKELSLIDDSGAAQTVPITFGPGTMKMTAPDGSIILKIRTRDPSDGQSIILGDWSYDYLGQAMAFERYTQDGRMLFRLPMRTETGSYVLDKKERIRITTENGKTVKWRFNREGKELLTGPKGKQQRYRLVEAGQWYAANTP